MAEEIDALLGPGKTHYWLGQYDSARLAWGDALSRVNAAGDSLSQANLLTWLGLAAYRLGDYATARSEGEAALELKLALGDETELARSYNALGLLADAEDRLLDAIRLYGRTMTAARAVDDDRMRAVAAGNLGLIHVYLGDLEQGSALLREMRDGAIAVADPRLEANALTNLAMVALWSGDPQGALEPLDTARRLYAEFGDYPLGEQHVLAQRAIALSDMGQYRGAIAALDTALALARRHSMKDQEAENRRLLGSLFAELGDDRRALRHYDEAAAIAREMELESELGNISRLSAVAHLSLGSLGTAVRDAEAALAAHRASGEPFEELDDLLLLAAVRQRMGDDNGEEAMLRSARLIAEQLDVASAHSTVALAEARHADAAGRHRQVLAAANRARAASIEGDFRTAAEISGLAARAYAALGQLDSAAVEGLAAVHALDRVRGDLASTELRGSLTASSARIYGDVVLILLQQDRSDEAFAVADGARSRELLHRLTARTFPAEGDASISDAVVGSRDAAAAELLLRRIQALLTELDFLESVPPAERGAGAAATSGEVLRRIDRLRDEYESHIIRTARLDDRSAGVLGRHGVDHDRVRAALAPDEALLHYTLTRDQLVLFVGRQHGLRTVTVPVSADDLTSRVRLLRALMGFRDAAPDRGIPAARALHEVLISSARDTGLLEGVDRLLIVPHGVLEQLPFALLHDPATGRYLIQDYVIAYAPSAGAIPALRGARPPAPDVRATDVQATSAFAPFPDELPGTGAEAAAAHRLAPEGRLYRGRRATEAAARRALAGSAVVHIASHGVLNARNPSFSRIRLTPGPGAGSADDGRLEVHEVLGLRVRSRLVVLSGCETALADDWSGDPLRPAGIASLSQAFLQAGASNVLATLWRVDDVGSAELVTRFYERSIDDVPHALAMAQRDMIAHPDYSAPYYWAGYVLAGSGRGAVSPQQPAYTSVP